jgi:hypothetical protein
MVAKTPVTSSLVKLTLFIILLMTVVTVEPNKEAEKEKKQKVIGCVRLIKARVFLDEPFFDEIEKNHDPTGKLDYKAKLMSAGLLNCVRSVTLEKAKSVFKNC